MLGPSLRFFLSAPVLAVGAVFFYYQIPRNPDFVLPVAVTAAMIGLFGSFVWRRLSLVIAGASLCILPLFGPGVVNFYVSCWLFGTLLRQMALREDQVPLRVSEKYALIGFLALLLAFLSSAIQTFFLEFDLLIPSTILGSGGILSFKDYLLSQFRSWSEIPLSLFGYVIPAILLFTLSSGERALDRFSLFFLGLAVGAILSALICSIQIWSGVSSFVSLNRSAFWVMTGRFAGGFTDPNAFGIMSAFVVPILLMISRRESQLFFCFSAFCLFVMTLWSGSRTFWLGLGIWFVGLVIRTIRTRRSKAAVIAGALFALFCVVIVVLYSSPTLNRKLQEQVKVPTVVRVLRTLDRSESEQMLSSRVIFTRIAIEMWSESPWVGVGYGRFMDKQAETAEKLGIDLKNWRDNANNFYLHVLSETGLFGLLLIFFSFGMFAFSLSGELRKDQEPSNVLVDSKDLLFLSRFSLVVIAVLFLTGPHIFFDEVRYLLTALIALGISQVDSSREKNYPFFQGTFLFMALFYPLANMLIVANTTEKFTKGFYPREHGSEGSFAWTGKQASLALCPSEQQVLSLEFRVAHPDVTEQPVKVWLSVRHHEEKEPVLAFLLKDHNWKSVTLDPRVFPADKPSVIASIEVDRVWSPPGDPRWLGVMVKWPEEACRRK